MRYENVMGVVALFLVMQASAADPPSGAEGPATYQVTVLASNGPGNTKTVASVKAGQKVTVSAGKVLWKGGGSKGTAFTDWRGYKDRLERNGQPWMALIASVGKKDFPATAKEFSFVVPADGELVLFANDKNPNGNTGKGDVTVTVSSGK